MPASPFSHQSSSFTSAGSLPIGPETHRQQTKPTSNCYHPCKTPPSTLRSVHPSVTFPHCLACILRSPGAGSSGLWLSLDLPLYSLSRAKSWWLSLCRLSLLDPSPSLSLLPPPWALGFLTCAVATPSFLAPCSQHPLPALPTWAPRRLYFSQLSQLLTSLLENFPHLSWL